MDPAPSGSTHLPARTLARRKRERRLRADESDRLFRVGRVAALAEEVLGNPVDPSTRRMHNLTKW